MWPLMAPDTNLASYMWHFTEIRAPLLCFRFMCEYTLILTNKLSKYTVYSPIVTMTKERFYHRGLLTPGSSYEATLTTEQNVGQLTHMTFRWNNHIYNPLLPKFGATKIELVRGSDSKT